MPTTETITLYSFDELQGAAREKALNKHREFLSELDDWSEPVLDAWREKLEQNGFYKPKIYFSGFWSQGDGACFDAEINTIEAARSIGYNELELKILELADVTFSIGTTNHHYSHERCRAVELDGEDVLSDTCMAILNAEPLKLPLFLGEVLDDIERELLAFRLQNSELTLRRAVTRDGNSPLVKYLQESLEDHRLELSKSIYKDLQEAYDYEVSDENVIESIRANEYRFLEDGTLWKDV